MVEEATVVGSESACDVVWSSFDEEGVVEPKDADFSLATAALLIAVR